MQIASVVSPASNKWTLQYSALHNDGRRREEFIIDHTFGETNIYRINSETLSSSELARPFAGSDFWLCDLALEFFHWPRQRVLRHEMRRSRSCWILESSTPTPAPGGYARVLSWIDVEHDGILRAEAYDKAGKLMKEFSLGSLRKIDGRYQLESMKMRNVRTGQESEIKFDLPQK